ncbi:ABC transporter ATP-binding protein [Treponema primitia]|uniref:ABC transporter ATP-binding protein n=1 Tax=Treponema primitia TaxID=88058 RepID=UPI00025558A2|nr:ABC transporter ATP-binding protein [Treponema primitia]
MSEPLSPLLKIENLQKDFSAGSTIFSRNRSRLTALDKVSLEIRRGECFGLVGESGSGKSTLARCILKLLTPTGGSIVFDGKTIFDSGSDLQLSHTEMLGLRKEMQIIFQDPSASLDPRMSALEIVAEGIKKHRVVEPGDIEKTAGDYLELCGISRSMGKRRPGEFSGGQKQRIGIARSLALQPSFIAADEPLSALDVSVQSQILNLLRDLHRQFNLTILFISHDLQTVEYFCDRIGVLYLGALVETGAAEDITGNPLHPYTRALFSAVPSGAPGDKRSRIELHGEIPSPINAPRGCKFHTRCTHASERCQNEVPVFEDSGNGHLVACHLWRQLWEALAGKNAASGI